MSRIEQEIHGIIDSLTSDYHKNRPIDKMNNLGNQPDKEKIVDVIDKLFKIMYPGYFRDRTHKVYDMRNYTTMLIEDVMYRLNQQIKTALWFNPENEKFDASFLEAEAERLSIAFFKKIPEIRAYLDTDLQAAYDGDPAAYYKDEIILAYPGFYAITVNRIAHELFCLGVPMIPRIMTEHAHSITGIDIHPGATIGKYFFIDHGTGIVIGETTEIGEHVKIYQGVTLGALSTRGGQSLRGVKRHPKLEDNVTIYAGASILGGNTVIGEGAVIGSNVFITNSVEPGARVSIKNQELHIKKGQKSVVEKCNLEQEEPWETNEGKA